MGKDQDVEDHDQSQQNFNRWIDEPENVSIEIEPEIAQEHHPYPYPAGMEIQGIDQEIINHEPGAQVEDKGNRFERLEINFRPEFPHAFLDG